MTDHVYFDLDGTLTDPFDGITRCIVYAIEQLGFERPDDAWLHRAIGPPLWDTFPEIVGADLTRKAIDLYRERFDDVGWQENKPYAGIHDTLATVKASGARLFVATAKPHPAARRIIEHYDMAQFFDSVYGSELDGTRSNKADLLAYALEREGPATRRIMIGDRKHDLFGALANAMTPIGVSYGYGSKEELLEAGAVAIADTPAAIAPLVV